MSLEIAKVRRLSEMIRDTEFAISAVFGGLDFTLIVKNGIDVGSSTVPTSGVPGGLRTPQSVLDAATRVEITSDTVASDIPGEDFREMVPWVMAALVKEPGTKQLQMLKEPLNAVNNVHEPGCTMRRGEAGAGRYAYCVAHAALFVGR